MSRIGRKPIAVPAGVEIQFDGNTIRVKGPKGELSRALHQDMIIKHEDATLTVERPSDERDHRSLHGLTRSLVANMVEGVTNGYTRELALEGTGYRAAKAGNKVTLTVGFSHPVEVDPPDGITLDVPKEKLVIVRGIDKEVVGQVASNIRSIRPPEPYLGKGIRYVGERVRRKAGKAGKK